MVTFVRFIADYKEKQGGKKMSKKIGKMISFSSHIGDLQWGFYFMDCCLTFIAALAYMPACTRVYTHVHKAVYGRKHLHSNSQKNLTFTSTDLPKIFITRRRGSYTETNPPVSAAQQDTGA